MRELSSIILIALFIFGLLVGSASAAVTPFSGSIGVSIAGLPPIGATGVGLATVNGSGGGAHVSSLIIPSAVFSTASVVVPVTDPGAFPILGVQATLANGTGIFIGGGATGTLAGPMAIQGVAKVCLFAACGASPPANVSIPLSVIGVGGTTTASVLVSATVVGNPWTTGTAAIGTVVQSGFAHGPASLTSSTASASGMLRLVTPTLFSTNLGVLPTFGIFDLHLGVPEPDTLLLLGTGVAGLVLFGRSRRS